MQKRIVLAMTIGLALRAGAGLAQDATATDVRVRELIKQLTHDDPHQRVAAADALARMGEAARPAVRPMLEAMVGKSAWVDFSLMDGLADLGPVALPTLIEVFDKGPDNLRAPAGRALWTMGHAAKDAIGVLERVSKDESAPKNIQALAANALQKVRSELAERSVEVAQPPEMPPFAKVNTLPGAGEWPAFQGPRRDSICREGNLLREWPEQGPPLLWKLEGLGKGLSNIAIAGGRLFTMGERENKQYALCYDLAGRKELWAVEVGTKYEYGPLSTPTVDGERVYVLSTDGKVFCLAVSDGKVLWQRDLVKEFGGKMMCVWKYSESLLVDGERLICTPGGPKAMMAALDKTTGGTLWQCEMPSIGDLGADGAGYSSPVVAEIAGVRQYVNIVGRGAIGVEASTGKFLWGYNRIACKIANITHPVVHGDFVFVTNSYNTGSALLRVKREDATWKTEEVYFLARRKFENHHGGVVVVNGAVYGGSGLDRGEPTCVDFATGRIHWKAKAPSSGSASILYANGDLVFRYDRGLVVLAEATPREFRVKGKFQAPTGEGPAWVHPVVHDGKLYLRHSDLLLCYDLKDS